MRRTKVVSKSLPEELIIEMDEITSNPEYKFYSSSECYAYILNLGINSFKDGQRLVSFVDSLLGKTQHEVKQNGNKHNTNKRKKT